MRKGERTRQQILEIAEAAVLQKGFGGTSIDELVAEANLTKSGFLYHFRDKNQLALALIQRYIDNDRAIFDNIFDRAAELSDDPLQRMLIGLKLLAELLDDIEGGHPGCLVATVCYQERLFDREVITLNREAVLEWRARFRGMFDDIEEKYEPAEPQDTQDLADMITTIIEGGIVTAKALGEPPILPRQILLLRSYIKLMFQPKNV
ncbi:MAG: TetR/AcrR family transcriptional regulator [Alphaproteobacteria bacterium]